MRTLYSTVAFHKAHVQLMEKLDDTVVVVWVGRTGFPIAFRVAPPHHGTVNGPTNFHFTHSLSDCLFASGSAR